MEETAREDTSTKSTNSISPTRRNDAGFGQKSVASENIA
ncbi:hypothetical protein COLO4_33626 [Corchorus olitorius]|uniref:Uncharacterized protein n=1 Tax=Corchorus olitorius TaxID=93759 RepID=A0A1R3GSG8_9ROSI|nr:hypothetical protein COLO4_33626 [Corchorus olitorius]